MQASSPEIAIIGATGKLGRMLVARLVAGGYRVRGLGRRAEALAGLGLGEGQTRVADLDVRETLFPALEGATHIVNAAHARFTTSILACLPNTTARLVVLGSTRRFTRFPDEAARSVIAAEDALRTQSSTDWIMLHPTMIYGAQGENNLGRLARLIRLTPIIPLPGGGRALVQPIHVGDVADATIAAILEGKISQAAVTLAGPAPMAYANLVRAVGSAIGKRPIILPLPYLLVQTAAFLLRRLSWLGLPSVGTDEIRRLLEDKAFDPVATQQLLGRPPRPLEDGLKEMFGG